jgi:hypothetical protein
LNPPRSLRQVYARQPWTPVNPETGIPPTPASAVAILGAIQFGQPLANELLYELTTAVDGIVGNLSSPDSPPQAGPPVLNVPSSSMKSYRRFNTGLGFASIEIWGADANQLNEAWICVPRGGLGNQPEAGLLKDAVLAFPGVYSWYRYLWSKDTGRFEPDYGDLTSTPYPPLPSQQRPPRLDASGDWCHHTAYGALDVAGEWLGTGSDPHWVPMLVGEKSDGANPWIGDIHRLMQSAATQQQATALLNSARPSDDVDLKE